jgi:hypothetical protein
MREGDMSSKPLKRLYKAATGGALRRDRIEMASIDRLLSRCAPAQDVDARVLFGDARLEIAKVVATERAGLVITSLRAPGDWFAPRRGSIS